MNNLLFPSRLPEDAGEGSRRDVPVWVLDGNATGFCRMFELVMRTFHPIQNPAFAFQPAYHLPAIHGGYYTHSRTKIKFSVPRHDGFFSETERKSHANTIRPGQSNPNQNA